jgi:starvation-inducible DNA-binding protein
MHTYESKQQLASKLAEVLADLNIMSSVSHGFHWNVKGMDFSEYHAFFGAIYEDVSEAIDPTAENILKLGFDAPYLLQDFLSLTSVNIGRVGSSDPRTMLQQLAEINAQVIKCHYEAFNTANECNSQGVADFLAGRIDIHEKWQWQIAASLGVSVLDLVPAQYGMPEVSMPAPAAMEEPVMAPDFEELEPVEFSLDEPVEN